MLIFQDNFFTINIDDTFVFSVSYKKLIKANDEVRTIKRSFQKGKDKTVQKLNDFYYLLFLNR